MNLKHKIYFFFLLLLTIQFNAQVKNFITISLEEGLSQSDVSAILEDSRGYLWVGTKGGGINLFDGNKFKILEEKQGLNGNIVTCIEEDYQNRIWVGTTWGGISIYNGKYFSSLNVESGISSNEIVDIKKGRNGTMVIAFNSELNIVNGKRIIKVALKDAESNQILKLFSDKQGDVWVITKLKLYRLEEDKLVDFSTKHKLTIVPSCITQDKNGNIWLGTMTQGIYLLNKAEKNSYSCTNFIQNDTIEKLNINELYFDSKNTLWIGTTGNGIVKYDFRTIESYNKSNVFRSNIINCITEDHFGNVWFGAQGGGLIRYYPGPFTYFDNLEGMNSNNIFGVLNDTKGNTWVCASGLGVFKNNENEHLRFSKENGLPSNNMVTATEDSLGNIFVGGVGGMVMIRNNTVKKINLPEQEVNINCLYTDSKNRIWIGTKGKGLIKYENNSFTIYNASNGLNFDYVYSVIEDKRGDIWVGTGNGIKRIKENSIENFELSSGFCNSYIGSLTIDLKGNIWMGTDRCIIRYNGNEFKSFDINDGLSSNTIFFVKCDLQGNIWVGSNKGIDRVSLLKNGDIGNIKNYGISEGFKGIECNSRSVSMDKFGNMYFGTVKGLIKYNPKEDKTRTYKTIVHINDMHIAYKEVNWLEYTDKINSWGLFPKYVQIPYGENNVTFEFVGLNLHTPDKVKYLIKLRGFDKDWVGIETQQVTYTNLPPGDYTFYVRAFTDDPSFYSEVTLPFKIKRPFWMAWWFYLLLLIVIVFSVYFIVKVRTKKTLLDKQRLEVTIQNRTAEILKQKLEIETLYKEVHHRVKNNLQVINSLINLQSSFIEDEYTLSVFKECQNRIYTMAILHEKLYTNTDLTDTQLEPYLGRIINFLIHVYGREDVKIESQIKIKKVGLDTIIPLGLIINEIVSNSLKYAFDKENNEPLIYLKCNYMDHETYRMEIGDNGKGFSEKSAGDKISFGLELINILIDQLNGTITKLDKPGTHYVFTFKDIEKDIYKTP